ncbi:hypothetical protein [Nocardioides sp. SYSU D00038]|uniref:hypothetical protein n=1 Tax=Nocardioides sp. SYSU D00038 TaxID=2812554 RepID=UPI00196712F0|nr:hypothetical protein [Nocardioides sp. SYSU D00038]
MSDPEQPAPQSGAYEPYPAAEPADPADGLRKNGRLFQTLGLSDLAIGVFLLLIGLTQDVTALVVVGVVFVVLGAGMTAAMTVARNRPTRL